jgi:hypothetical protein
VPTYTCTFTWREQVPNNTYLHTHTG